MVLAVDEELDLAREYHGRLPAARLVQGWIAGASGRRAGCERVERDVGPLAGQRRRQLLQTVTSPAPGSSLPRPHYHHVAVLVQAQQMREGQVQAGGDLLRDGERRAGLTALDLREHRRAHPAAPRQ